MELEPLVMLYNPDFITIFGVFQLHNADLLFLPWDYTQR